MKTTYCHLAKNLLSCRIFPFAFAVIPSNRDKWRSQRGTTEKAVADCIRDRVSPLRCAHTRGRRRGKRSGSHFVKSFATACSTVFRIELSRANNCVCYSFCILSLMSLIVFAKNC